ncbi:unnamed protein product [Rotaria sp. Silwood1]|nr:unnamed protein product [Rotaria sp. Silwood1]
MIREVTEANTLTSLYSTNWKIKNVNPSEFSYLYTEPVQYPTCNCGISPKCSQPSGNQMSDCYPLEALLHSTLECFYDQQCVDATKTFKALNSSASISRFDLNATFEAILEELMIEQYSINVSYKNYFDQCTLSSCSYSYNARQETIDLITSFLGLYGGLTIISQAITTLTIRFLSWKKPNIVSPLQ